jgi:hypothetical protein
MWERVKGKDDVLLPFEDSLKRHVGVNMTLYVEMSLSICSDRIQVTGEHSTSYCTSRFFHILLFVQVQYII